MAIDDLDPVALEAYLLAHAMLKKLEIKGLLTADEAGEIIKQCRFALRIIDLDKDERTKSAEAVLII
jgi:hypothetical protein